MNEENTLNLIPSARNTIKAGWLEMAMVNIFGRKIKFLDEKGRKVTQARYRGKLYYLGDE